MIYSFTEIRFLLISIFFFSSCDGLVQPRPKAMLKLEYPIPEYKKTFNKYAFDFEFNQSFTNIKEIDNNSIYFLRLLSESSLCDIFWLVPRNKQILFNIYNFIYETDIELDNISEHITMKFIDYHNLSNNLKKFSAECTIDRSYIKNIN